MRAVPGQLIGVAEVLERLGDDPQQLTDGLTPDEGVESDRRMKDDVGSEQGTYCIHVPALDGGTELGWCVHERSLPFRFAPDLD